MTPWNPDEVRIAGRRPDGSLRPARIVWMVRLGEEIYTRSVNGPQAAWFRGTRASHEGRISAGARDIDVRFADVDAGDPVQDQLDAAYRDKYARRYPGPTSSITSSTARAATLKIIPLHTETEG